MSENQQLEVTNPLQAASEIFYKPKGVFHALAVKDNWSWVPFIVISIVAFLPSYLYFNLVDFEWWRNQFILLQAPDASPAEIENMRQLYPQAAMKWSTGIFAIIGPIIINLIIAFYYSLVTRNDNKSVHGFTDWYGAMWWMSMPMLINALISLILLTLQEPGSQITNGILAPLSLAYVSGTEFTSPYFNLLASIRIDVFWSVWLGSICLMTWTNFQQTKALIIAAIPVSLYWLVTAIILLMN